MRDARLTDSLNDRACTLCIGLAMSRSLGDSCLDDIGVQPVPEVTVRALKPKDRFMVIASDGVWQGLLCVCLS